MARFIRRNIPMMSNEELCEKYRIEIDGLEAVHEKRYDIDEDDDDRVKKIRNCNRAYMYHYNNSQAIGEELYRRYNDDEGILRFNTWWMTPKQVIPLVQEEIKLAEKRLNRARNLPDGNDKDDEIIEVEVYIENKRKLLLKIS